MISEEAIKETGQVTLNMIEPLEKLTINKRNVQTSTNVIFHIAHYPKKKMQMKREIES